MIYNVNVNATLGRDGSEMKPFRHIGDAMKIASKMFLRCLSSKPQPGKRHIERIGVTVAMRPPVLCPRL